MTALRLSTSMVTASGVTLGLAFLMQSLVAYKDEIDLSPEPRWAFPDVLAEVTTAEPIRQTWDVPKPPEPITAPPAPPVTPVDPGTVTPIYDPHGPYTPDPDDTLDRSTFGRLSDGDMLPLVRVQPTYPRRALTDGVQGYAIVSLTVLEDGSVDPASIVILEAEPAGYFETEARKAAAKFKYKPKVLNGVALAVPHVQYKFTFGLE